jgi:DNA (cytosine-5)-methyltransferase 1
VDSPYAINTVEWFFGYGGNHLGLKRCIPNLRLVAACEIEEFAIENILAKMESGWVEAAPVWSDCRTFPWEPFVDRIDLFVASYPCQPFSAAGKRGGAEDPRHLWPVVLNWILRVRPLCVFAENVEGHVSLGLSTVISDLEEAGYRVEAGIFSASEVGAPHQRKRVFIMAHRKGSLPRFTTQWKGWEGIGGGSQEGGEVAHSRSICPKGSNTNGANRERICELSRGTEVRSETIGCGSSTPELANDDGKRGNKLGGKIAVKSYPPPLGTAVLFADYPSNRSQTGVSRQEQGHEGATGIADNGGGQIWPSRPGQHQYEWEPPRVVGNAKMYDGRDISKWHRTFRPKCTSSGMVNAERILLSAPGEHGVMAEESNNAVGEGSQPTQAGAESGAARERKGRRADAAECNEAQPSVGGNPNGTPCGVGHAELYKSDHADSAADAEHGGGQLDDTRGTELHGLPDQQRSEDPAPWESSDGHLYVSCDNRTDELRLLGNGVCPQTCELAFRTLWEELTK